MTETLSIRCPFNTHTHLRNARPSRASGAVDANRSARYFQMLLDAAAAQFAIIGPMPNTAPPLTTWQRVVAYNNAVRSRSSYRLETMPIMQVTAATTVEDIKVASICGIALGKVYPEDGLTYSTGGGGLGQMGVQLRAMEKYGLRLLAHLEVPGLPPAEREAAALPMIQKVRQEFKHLSIVVEHVSTAVMAEWILHQGRFVGGSIALQHAWFTEEDFADYRAHLRCAPVVKTAEDRAFLQQLLFTANPQFWLIDDNAPHPEAAKNGANPPSGVFWGRHTLAAAATLFEKNSALHQLETCVSVNPSNFFGVRRNSRVVTLRRKAEQVQRRMGPYRPILAGQELPWSLAR